MVSTHPSHPTCGVPRPAVPPNIKRVRRKGTPGVALKLPPSPRSPQSPPNVSPPDCAASLDLGCGETPSRVQDFCILSFWAERQGSVVV